MEVCAIVLAAGLSQRMGQANKLALQLGGKSLLRNCVEVLLASHVQRVDVITGHQPECVAQLLDGLAVQLHFNPDYSEGQMTSVHRGLALARPRAKAVMVCLADQVLLSSADVNALIAAFAASDQQRILVPTFAGVRGNPLIIPRHLVAQIVQGERNLGCKNLLQRQPELMLAWPMSNDHAVVDIDTPEDYHRVRARVEVGHSTTTAG